MKGAIIKSTMNHVCTFVLSQSTDFIEQFNNHLKTFWGQYHLFVFNNNKMFSLFQGSKLSKWVRNIPETIAILQDELEDADG